jgi:hypothetical protein
MKEKYRKFLVVLEYALPFTEFYRRNDVDRIDGVSICFDSFSNSLVESSIVIFNKSPIYFISRYFFTFTAQKMALAIGQQRSI